MKMSVCNASADLYNAARNLEDAIIDTGSIEHAAKFRIWLKIIECINEDLEKMV
jgi:hypothetical protein